MFHTKYYTLPLKYVSSTSLDPFSYNPEMMVQWTRNNHCQGGNADWISWSTRFKFLLNPAYALVCLSNFLFFMVLGVPFTFGPDLLVKNGYEPEAASYMITCIGMANMLGQILVGAFVDLPWVNSSVVTSAAMLICGLAMTVLPTCQTYIQAGHVFGCVSLPAQLCKTI